ncbi:MAG TPA: hypothetical protein VF175_00035 [Lacipirellula sp.]
MKVLQLVLCALSLLGLGVRVDAAVLYGATASGAAGRLFRLDPATGAQLQDVGPLSDAAGTNYPITGMAFHPTTGVLYGSTGNNPQATAALLVTIDPATALVTVVGAFNTGITNSSGTPSTMGDIGFDAAGNLFGVGTIGGPQLYSIDAATAQATVIGNTGLTSTTGGGLAISSAGIFYGTPTASRYGTYDSTTGAYTNITNPVKPGGGGAYAALDFSPAGVLYGLNSAPGSPPPTFLVTIDPATGTVTSLGGSVQSLDAIAFRIPEPSVLMLLVPAAVALVRRRR